jgi:hypothetical protein
VSKPIDLAVLFAAIADALATAPAESSGCCGA